MKSEERHKLQENDLAESLNSFPELLKKYGTYALLVIAFALLIYQLFNYWQRKQEQTRLEAFSQFQSALTAAKDVPSELQRVAEQYDVKPIQALAYAHIGNVYREYVLSGQSHDPRIGDVTREQALDRAQTAYEKVLNDFPDQQLPVDIARTGEESLAETRGDWDKAKQLLDSYLALYPKDSAMYAVLDSRKQNLAEWQKPVRFGVVAADTQPAIGTGLGMPFDPNLLNSAGPSPTESQPALQP